MEIFPILFDFVQPAKEIMAISEKTPRKKETDPISRGKERLDACNGNGYPSVVMSNNLVIAKIETKKKLAAKVETIRINFTSLVSTCETKRLAMMAIENPPRSELMVMI